MRSVLIVLICPLAALELSALIFAAAGLARGPFGVEILSVAIAVSAPLIGLFGAVSVYRRQRAAA